MNISPMNIIPITEARGRLGDLADKAQGEQFFVLTKKGSPQAVLVDISYFEKLQKELFNIYQRTFIDPKLLPLTREFTNSEIKEWEKEDSLAG